MSQSFTAPAKRIVIGLATIFCISGPIFIQVPAAIGVEVQATAQQLYEQGVEQAAGEQYSAAIQSFSQAIALEPEFAQAYSARGRAQVLAGDRRAAFQDLEQSSRLHMAHDQLEEALSDMNLMIDLLEMGMNGSNRENNQPR